MTVRRSDVFRPGDEGIYHCGSRCVRRGWLMGDDPLTGKNHNRRRRWALLRLSLMCQAFSIDLLFFAILANHFHVVLRTMPRLAKRWPDREVARRWLMVFPGKRTEDPLGVEPADEDIGRLARNKDEIKKIRRRLSDISWWHRAFKEPLSRLANAEDGCSGAFWESRVWCRLVEGREGLFAVGLYNDLNLLRAGQCADPWATPYCSIGMRVLAEKIVKEGGADPAPWLAQFTLSECQTGLMGSSTGLRASDLGCLDMTLDAYLKILRWAADESAKPRSGGMPQDLGRLARSQGLNPEKLSELIAMMPKIFPRMIGRAGQLRARAKEDDRHWFQGVGRADEFFD